MTKITKILAVTLCASMLLGNYTPICATETSSTETTVESTEKTVTIKKVKQGVFTFSYSELTDTTCWLRLIEIEKGQQPTSLVVPEKLEGKTVTKIGNPCDSNGMAPLNIFGAYCSFDGDELLYGPDEVLEATKKIKRVQLPETITEMLQECFTQLPNLRTFKFPEKMTTIPEWLFHTCPKLKEIEISKNVSSGLEYLCCFWDKFTLPKENPYYKVKNGLLLSKDGTIVYGPVKNKKTAIIPYGVTTIPEEAFYHATKYKRIHIPATVKKIENYAFTTSNILKITVSKKSKHFAKDRNCIYRKKDRSLVAITGNKKVTISSKVRVLEKGISFCGKKIKKIVIPKSVKKLGEDWLPWDFGRKLYFKGMKPPIISMYDLIYGNNKYYVPKKAKKKYKKYFMKLWNYEERLVELVLRTY